MGTRVISVEFSLALIYLAIVGLAGSTAQEEPRTSNKGTGYTRFDNVIATGTTPSVAGAVSNVVNIEADDINVEGSGHGAYYSGLTVQDPNFGGSNARGGRIVIGGSLRQTRPTSHDSILRDYVGIQGFVNTESGDGGTTTQARGQYYGLWSVATAGPNARYIDALLGEEVDLGVQAGSEVNNKSGIMISHGSPNGARDAVQGKKNDNMFWAWGAPRHVGSRFGFQFGRSDILADYGVAADGSLIGTVGTSPIAYGINVTSAKCLTACWASKGATIDGSGNAKFEEVTARFREVLTTPASSKAACYPGQFTDDTKFHYVCVAKDKWKRVLLSDF